MCNPQFPGLISPSKEHLYPIIIWDTTNSSEYKRLHRCPKGTAARPCSLTVWRVDSYAIDPVKPRVKAVKPVFEDHHPPQIYPMLFMDSILRVNTINNVVCFRAPSDKPGQTKSNQSHRSPRRGVDANKGQSRLIKVGGPCHQVKNISALPNSAFGKFYPFPNYALGVHSLPVTHNGRQNL
jgi:hypothetical protein